MREAGGEGAGSPVCLQEHTPGTPGKGSHRQSGGPRDPYRDSEM